jgi:hypothetical protein
VALIAERQRYYQEWKDLETYEAELKQAERTRNAAKGALDTAEDDLKAAVRRRDAASAEVERTRRIRDEWQRQRPRFFASLLRGGGELRAWRRRAREYVTSANAAWDLSLERDEAVLAAEALAAERSEALAAAQASLRKSQAVLARRRVAAERARDRFGNAYPAPTAERAVRELIAPWCDEELNAARSELFLEALRLHRSFIEHNSERFKSGLGVAVDVVKRKAPADLAHEIRVAAWQLLFIAVPVVSTTFASVARQFTGLREGDLGWLLIDEAGQATPQAAVGAIWRTRHVMVVGDPLQLEPVLSLPNTIQQSLREHYGLSEYWVPPAAPRYNGCRTPTPSTAPRFQDLTAQDCGSVPRSPSTADAKSPCSPFRTGSRMTA